MYVVVFKIALWARIPTYEASVGRVEDHIS